MQASNSNDTVDLVSSDDESKHDSSEIMDVDNDAAFAASLQRQFDAEVQQHHDSDAAFAASLQQQQTKTQHATTEHASDAAFAASLQQQLYEEEWEEKKSDAQQEGCQQYDSDAAFAAALQQQWSAAAGDEAKTKITSAITTTSWIQSQSPDSSVCTTGMLDLICAVYNQNANSSSIDKNTTVYLSKATADHYHQVINPQSRGQRFGGEPQRLDGYSCGYRSMQMICSALLKAHTRAREQLLFGGCGFVPSLEDMKHWLEHAWNQGWDPVGCAQLCPVVGKSTWVGTTECWALLSSFGISAKIVSFTNDAKKKKKQTVGISTSTSLEQQNNNNTADIPVARQVEQWLWDYFDVDEEERTTATKRKNPWDQSHHSSSQEGNGNIRMSDKLPLYMQHDGHSRVVIGIAIRGPPGNRETQLLIFDPSTYGPNLKAALSGNTKKWHGMLKRGLHTLKKPEYEFVVVSPNEPMDPNRSKYPDPDNQLS